MFTYSLANGVEGIAIATPASAPRPASPELQIQMPDSLHIRLAWTTNAAGFTLVSAPSLPASAWNPITNAPVLDGDQLTVVLELGSAPQYFQLCQ